MAVLDTPHFSPQTKGRQGEASGSARHLQINSSLPFVSSSVLDPSFHALHCLWPSLYPPVALSFSLCFSFKQSFLHPRFAVVCGTGCPIPLFFSFFFLFFLLSSFVSPLPFSCRAPCSSPASRVPCFSRRHTSLSASFFFFFSRLSWIGAFRFVVVVAARADAVGLAQLGTGALLFFSSPRLAVLSPSLSLFSAFLSVLLSLSALALYPPPPPSLVPGCGREPTVKESLALFSFARNSLHSLSATLRLPSPLLVSAVAARSLVRGRIRPAPS